MRALDLCSGIGGFSLGLEAVGFETIAFCEIEPYCRGVLEKHWPGVPIYEDIKQLSADRLKADGIVPDIICGGYPCQPFSYAGYRRGKEDDRHIWPFIIPLVAGLRPAWCVFENVYGHISMGIDDVLDDLESEGYATRTFVLPALAVDAKHRRDRVWIIARNVADTDHHDGRTRSRTELCERQTRLESGGGGERQRIRNTTSLMADSDTGLSLGQNGKIRAGRNAADGSGKTVADSDRTGFEQGDKTVARRSSEQFDGSGFQPAQNVSNTDSSRCQRRLSHGKSDSKGREVESYGLTVERSARREGNRNGEWPPEPGVGRVVDGIQNRAHRIKGLGNAIVPQIVTQIGKIIREIDGLEKHY